MCRFLHGPRNGVYYFRRPIPEPLRPIVGQREWMYSLRVKERGRAKELVALETVRTDWLLASAKRALAAERGNTDPAHLARQHRAEVQRERLEEQEWAEREARQGHDKETALAEAERLERIEAQADAAAHLEHVLRTGNTAAMNDADAVAIREIRDMREKLAVAQEHLSIARSQMSERAAGDSLDGILPPPLSSVPNSPSASHGTPQGNLEAVTVTGLFKMLVATGRLSPAIASEWQSGINKFVAFVGHDDARRVTSQDVLRWRNNERNTPKSNGEARSAQRINAGYLGAVRAAFKYGMEEMLIDADPAAAVPKLREAAKAVTRDRQFTKAEQRLILTAASKVDTSGKPSYQDLVRRWVPWLCAYSGARVNEITQLRAEDVQEVDGHWIIQITPAAGRVKSNAFRNVPIHPHLIEQGFLALVKAQGKGPLFYDPDKGNADSERGQYKKAGERLAAWVRTLGISDPSIAPNHAWRHTFTSIAMECGMDERAADYIKGHASQGVSRKFYTHHTVGPLAEQLAKFPRFDV